MGKYLNQQYEKCDLVNEIADLTLSCKRQEKLLKEADVLFRTFWHLVSSSEKCIIFKDFYSNRSFLSSAESLHVRIKKELGVIKKKGGV